MTAPDPLAEWRRLRPSTNKPTLPIIKAVQQAFAEKGYVDKETRMKLGRQIIGKPVTTYDEYVKLLGEIEKLPAQEQAEIPFN